MTDLIDKAKQLGISHFTVHDFVDEIERLQAENKYLREELGNPPLDWKLLKEENTVLKALCKQQHEALKDQRDSVTSVMQVEDAIAAYEGFNK